MDVNGCHIVSGLNMYSPDGFESVVSRYVGFNEIPETIPEDAVKVSKGPFYRQVEAIKYALKWTDASNPPAMVPHEDLIVNGCKVASHVEIDSPDGIVSTVSRTIIVHDVLPADAPEGTPAPEPREMELIQGPFHSIKEAVDYANLWVNGNHPPAIADDPHVEPGNGSTELTEPKLHEEPKEVA